MNKVRTVLGLGVWVAVLPFLGFPYSWKDVLFTISGLMLAYFSFLIYRERKSEVSSESVFDNFSENI